MTDTTATWLRSKLEAFSVVAVAAICGGCAIGVQITAVPRFPKANEPVTFTIKQTNHGICPVKSTLIVLPFLTSQEIFGSTGGSEEAALVPLLCDGQVTLQEPAPVGSITCRLVNDLVTCTLPPGCMLDNNNGVVCADRAPGQTAQLLAATGCQLNSGRLECPLPPGLKRALDVAHNALQSVQSTATLSCTPVAPGFPYLSCGMTTLSPGGMTTDQVVLPARSASGSLRTLAFSDATDGVCKQGPPGTPCSDNSDCGTGTCMANLCSGGPQNGTACLSDSDCDGNCEDRVCTVGVNQGLGCDSDTDCGGTMGSCQSCFDSDESALFTTGAPTGIACATTGIPSTAPVASNHGLLALALVLSGLGAIMILRGYRRRA